jgi:putative nucleotidyltransferase with HDIG domain
MSQRNDPNYGKGVVELDIHEAYLLRPEDLTAQLLALFESPGYRPPTLPRVGLELHQLVRKPDVSIREVRALCEQDPLVAAEVVRRASTAAYRNASPVRSLDDAIMRLGLRTLSDYFLEVSFNLQVFRAEGFQGSLDRLATHSIATARIAQMVCQNLGLHDEHAFLAGLLHDMGVAAALITLSKSFAKQKAPDIALLRTAIDNAHQPAAGSLARLWDLPAELGLIIENHHTPLIGGRVHPTAAAVALADALSATLRLGCGWVDHERQLEVAAKSLDLSKVELERLKKLAESCTASLRGQAATPRGAVRAHAR